MGHPYPKTLPTECLTEVINDIRGGVVAERKSHFVNCVWTLAGFGLKLGFGDPDESEQLFGAVDVEPHVLDECQVALTSFKRDELDQPQFGAEGEEAIDPALVLAIIDLALKVIALIRERRNK